MKLSLLYENLLSLLEEDPEQILAMLFVTREDTTTAVAGQLHGTKFNPK